MNSGARRLVCEATCTTAGNGESDQERKRQTYASHRLVIVSERRRRKVFLLLLEVKNPSFDGVFDDESGHVDRPVLADSVGPVHSLELKSTREKSQMRLETWTPSSCDLPRPPGSTTYEERSRQFSKRGMAEKLSCSRVQDDGTAGLDQVERDWGEESRVSTLL